MVMEGDMMGRGVLVALSSGVVMFQQLQYYESMNPFSPCRGWGEMCHMFYCHISSSLEAGTST